MTITNCRGDELKAQIITKYDLACTAHLTLLDGQDKDGCCGRLTDEYYFFEYTAIEGDEAGGFFVGRHCALKFAELADIDLPAKFNPLVAMGAGGGGGGGGSTTRVQWHPLNRQLYTAIHVILTMWNKPPKRNFRKIVEWLRAHPDQKTKMWSVHFVHDMVVKYFPGQTLTEAWDKFREDYPNLKEYSFHHLAKAMEHERNNRAS